MGIPALKRKKHIIFKNGLADAGNPG